MTSNVSTSPRDDVGKLIERWCDRREYRALATVLPAWCANNRLSDGLGELRDAVRSTYAVCGYLPNEEREALKELSAKFEAAAQNQN
jgi:hypothetical protein